MLRPWRGCGPRSPGLCPPITPSRTGRRSPGSTHAPTWPGRPPGAVLPDLVADLAALQAVLHRTEEESIRRRLWSPGGKLAALIAMANAASGRRRQARDWWVAARHAADASGDRDLRVWVRGYEAMSVLYARRPLEAALKRADEAMAIAGPRPCAAVLEAMAARDQALAIRGDGDAAGETSAVMERLFGTLPPAPADDRLSVHAWPETALRHTQAFVFTHSGDGRAADRAVTADLYVPVYTEPPTTPRPHSAGAGSRSAPGGRRPRRVSPCWPPAGRAPSSASPSVSPWPREAGGPTPRLRRPRS